MPLNELYAVTADRANRVSPTIVQPTWDDSPKLGRRPTRPGSAESQRDRERAEGFRDARRAYRTLTDLEVLGGGQRSPAGSPPSGVRGVGGWRGSRRPFDTSPPPTAQTLW